MISSESSSSSWWTFDMCDGVTQDSDADARALPLPSTVTRTERSGASLTRPPESYGRENEGEGGSGARAGASVADGEQDHNISSTTPPRREAIAQVSSPLAPKPPRFSARRSSLPTPLLTFLLLHNLLQALSLLTFFYTSPPDSMSKSRDWLPAPHATRLRSAEISTFFTTSVARNVCISVPVDTSQSLAILC